MATAEQKKSLPNKQRRVLTLLERGKTIPDVAKAMKITPNAVYGHITRIEKHGVDMSAYRNGSSRNGKRKATHKPSGSLGVERFLNSLGNEEDALKDEAADLDNTINDAKHKLVEAEAQRNQVGRALDGIAVARERVKTNK